MDEELIPHNVAGGVKLPETTDKGRGRLRHVFTPAQLEEDFLSLADKTDFLPADPALHRR